VLDVKVKARHLRSLRVRLVAKLCALAIGTLTVLFLLWRGGDWLLSEVILPHPAFALQEMDVETDGVIPPQQLRTCVGAKVGDCLLVLDLNRIRRDLEYLPWVQSAAVERVRPHTLRVRVRERQAVAQTSLYQPADSSGFLEKVVFYFDAEGYAMLPLDIHRRQASALGLDRLPLLTGLAGADLRPGRQTESTQIRAALRLIKEFKRSPMFGEADLASIDVSVPPLLQVSTSQGAQIVFTLDGLELQLCRWRAVNDYALAVGKAIASLDLSVSNNVPARWFEASAVPAASLPAAFPKHYRYKKKNV
jgi:hypothetical protein